jgi:mycothiol synthase
MPGIYIEEIKRFLKKKEKNMALDLSGVKSRQYRGGEDLPALVELINEIGKAGGANLIARAENIKRFLGRPNVEPPQFWENSAGQLLMNVTLMLVFLEEEGSDSDKRSLEVRTLINVHPEARGHGLEDTLIAWCIERARQLGVTHNLPVTLAGRIEEDQTAMKEVFERNGFEIARYFFTMERLLDEPLPEASLPAGFTMHNGAGKDTQAWADLYNLSFIDHYHHHHMTATEVEYENHNPNYRPELDLVVVGPDGTWAAICYSQINPGEAVEGEQIGWIALLGTRRGYRNRGIGRAALLAGMRLLQGEGCRRIRLHVDAGSLTGATRLYEAVGFRVCQTSLHYSRKII